jgi:exodeoxyribonuclease-3
VRGVCICNVYVPNGNPVTSDKFEYRQRFMSRLIRHVSQLCSHHLPFMLVGDFNCVPGDGDCYNADDMRGDAVLHPVSRKQFQELSYLMGLYNSIDLDLARSAAAASRLQLAQQPASASPAAPFTYWDYRAGCWEKGRGLRIDHILLHPQVQPSVGVRVPEAAQEGAPACMRTEAASESSRACVPAVACATL